MTTLAVAPGGAVLLPHGHTRHHLTWGDAPPAVRAQEAPAHKSCVAGAGTETAPPARRLAQGTTPSPQPRAGKPHCLPHVGYGFPAPLLGAFCLSVTRRAASCPKPCPQAVPVGRDTAAASPAPSCSAQAEALLRGFLTSRGFCGSFPNHFPIMGILPEAETHKIRPAFQ